MKIDCAGQCRLKRNGHLTISLPVRIFVNRTKIYHFSILFEPNHTPTLVSIKWTFWAYFEFTSFTYIVIITIFHLHGLNTINEHLRNKKNMFFLQFTNYESWYSHWIKFWIFSNSLQVSFLQFTICIHLNFDFGWPIKSHHFRNNVTECQSFIITTCWYQWCSSKNETVKLLFMKVMIHFWVLRNRFLANKFRNYQKITNLYQW